jgi:hypothetical protein
VIRKGEIIIVDDFFELTHDISEIDCYQGILRVCRFTNTAFTVESYLSNILMGHILLQLVDLVFFLYDCALHIYDFKLMSIASVGDEYQTPGKSYFGISDRILRTLCLFGR